MTGEVRTTPDRQMILSDVQMPEVFERVRREVWISAVEFLCARLGRPELFGLQVYWRRGELEHAKSLDPSLKAGLFHPAIIFGVLFSELMKRLSVAESDDLKKLSGLSLADQVCLCAGSVNFYAGLKALCVSSQFVEIVEHILPDAVSETRVVTVADVEEALGEFLRRHPKDGELVDTRGIPGSGRPASRAVLPDEDIGTAPTIMAPLDLKDVLRKGEK
jgi:hypothetical protein